MDSFNVMSITGALPPGRDYAQLLGAMNELLAVLSSDGGEEVALRASGPARRSGDDGCGTLTKQLSHSFVTFRMQTFLWIYGFGAAPLIRFADPGYEILRQIIIGHGDRQVVLDDLPAAVGLLQGAVAAAFAARAAPGMPDDGAERQP